MTPPTSDCEIGDGLVNDCAGLIRFGVVIVTAIDRQVTARGKRGRECRKQRNGARGSRRQSTLVLTGTGGFVAGGRPKYPAMMVIKAVQANANHPETSPTTENSWPCLLIASMRARALSK
jgi:hypothetical protein